jgi:glycerophosphoryl diester phosphodiesterase
MTFVVAHRGSSESVRENTIASFAAAAENGAPWVELDVRAAADGTPVVHHDPLPPGRLPDWLPTLEAALDACAALGLGVVVEVKEVGVAAATSAILRDRTQEVVVSSFHPVALAGMKDAGKATALLVAPGMDAIEAIRVATGLGCSALHPHGSSVTGELVAACRAAGLDIVPWTVNEPRHLRRMADLAVTAVITDDVVTALVILRPCT